MTVSAIALFSLLPTSAVAQQQAVVWGYNNDDQVDDAPLHGDVAAIRSGGFHSMVLLEDGSLQSWGYDAHGQVSNTPSGNDFEAISAGEAHSLALRTNGSLISWGRDTDSNTGATTGQVSDTPSGSDFQAVACGLNHSLALRLDGTIAAWGLDDFGQVSSTPSGSDFVAIGAGRQHSFAIRTDGTILGWGRDTYGQVSNAPLGGGFISVDGGYRHSVALRSDGTIYAWGDDSKGQVSGTPTTGRYVAISAGGFHTLALNSQGELVAWGDDTFEVTSDTPTGDLFKAISADGTYHGMAIRATPGGYRWHHNPATSHYYSASEGITSLRVWLDAQADAAAFGGYLLSLNDAAEEAFVDSLFDNPSTSGVCFTQLYIGLRRVNGNWQWEDGSAYGGYQNWAPGFPVSTSSENFARKAWHSGANSEWANGDGGCLSLSIFEWEPTYDRDQDDDGILDLEEFPLYGTNPTLFDTDGDQIGDGLELGFTVGTPDTDLNVFIPDADPNTTTNPLLADTDAGGVDDNIEDQNQDGRWDTWETDPTNPTDDSPAFYVSNLSPGETVRFDAYGAAPFQLLVPAYSVRGPGPTQLGIGVAVSLSTPIQVLPTSLADVDGNASWNGPRVPTGVQLGMPIWLQMVEIPFTGALPRVSNAILLPVGAN